METVKINIDGKEIEVDRHLSVLDVAVQQGIDIPTLCYHRDLERYAACRVCLVEVQNARNPMPACVTQVTDGMVIQTRTDEIEGIRRVVLELLLSEHYGDCVAPCKIACPAGIDIQGQIALIADGRYEESLIRIKESNPLPLVCGRVCPRFCEQKCRRNLIEGPVGINMLKRFVADYDMNSDEPYTPNLKPSTGKKVAVIGGGPAGLSAAYYLVQEGHQVDIYESHPKLGGMLRYGIPEYRLPKSTLDKEIEGITKLCGKVETSTRLGKDFTIDSLKKDGYDAVFIAIGAQASSSMRVDGEDSPGVIAGIDFLRNVVMGNETGLGKKVAVVGGGNTAMDAARTALRMGAKVTVVYRRSRAEMPANAEEVEQAEEEGVEFVFLSAPVSIKVADGRVKGLECNRMELGEPDASGRRRPIPIEGSEYTIELDTIISAIGQAIDSTTLSDGPVELNKWGYPVIDEETMITSAEGVFSGGDCTAGPATAVEAIGAGKRAATYIDMYLSGKPVIAVDKPYICSKGELNEVRDSDYADVPTQARAEQEALAPDVRIKGFEEIELGLTEQEALAEAKRCLQCGCQDAYECKLRDYATEYKVDDSRYGARQYLEPKVKDVQNFINRDYNKCITCGMCVRMCQEVRGQGTVSFINRGSATIVGTAFGLTFEDAGCKFCAACVDVCPTGALLDDKNRWREMPDTEVATICPYCGVGCQLTLEAKNNKIIRSVPDDNGPANSGQACVKGRFGLTFVNSDERLKAPLIKKDGKLTEATWDEALDLVAEKFAQYDGNQFTAVSSAKATNEENYLIQKFTRSVMGTNNIDHCARLCHSPTVSGLGQTFGSGAMTNSISEIKDAECIFAIGTNTTVSHPVLALEIKKALKKGSKLIVANPRRVDLCDYADIWLMHKPGTDVALLGGMMKVIIDEGLADKEFIESRCENFDSYKQSLQEFDLSKVEAITGVPADKIAEAARIFASNESASILYAMGVTQHSHGTDNVTAVADLAMLTGNVGKPSTGVNPLRGQNNVQGACDMGALPNVYPGYHAVVDTETKAKFEKAWDAKLDDKKGLTLIHMFEAIDNGSIKAMYLMGENPVISEPDSSHIEKALQKLEFLVVQDIFLTETAQYADVVLPGASFAEKDGSFTNTERRVQRVRKAIDPVGGCRADWQIICQIAERIGAKGFDYASPEDVMREIADLVPIYGGISYERIDAVGLQWPCLDKDDPGTKYLHGPRFRRGKGYFVPLQYKPSMESADDEYPLIMTTGRSLYHFHAATMTRRIEGLSVMHPEEMMEINPEDARQREIADGDKISIISRRGKIEAKARVTDDVPPGVVFMTFHFAESRANVLTNPVYDPVSKIPEFKVTAVQVKKV